MSDPAVVAAVSAAIVSVNLHLNVYRKIGPKRNLRKRSRNCSKKLSAASAERLPQTALPIASGREEL